MAQQATWDNSPYFNPARFACRCKQCDDNIAISHIRGKEVMADRLIEELHKLRLRYGHPIYVTSGYRCISHPIEACKERPGSHNRGVSVDVAVEYDKLYWFLKYVFQSGQFRRIGISTSFIHLQLLDDIQYKDRIWVYHKM